MKWTCQDSASGHGTLCPEPPLEMPDPNLFFGSHPPGKDRMKMLWKQSHHWSAGPREEQTTGAQR